MHQVVARLPDVLVMSRTAFLTASDEQRTKKQNGSKWNLCKRTERICKLPEWILLPSRILLGRAIFFVNLFPFFFGNCFPFSGGRKVRGRKEGRSSLPMRLTVFCTLLSHLHRNNTQKNAT